MPRITLRDWRTGAAAAGVAVLVGVVAYFLAREGDGSPPAATTPAPFTDRSGLLPAEVLPGDAWSPAVDTRMAAGTPQLLLSVVPPVPECDGLRAIEAHLQESNATFDHGAARRYTREGGAGAAAHVRLAFTGPEAPAAAVARVRSAADRGEVVRCLGAAARREGLNVTVSPTGDAAAPPGGVSMLLAVAGEPGAGAAWQLLAWWQEGNELDALSVTSSGTPPPAAELDRLISAAAASARAVSSP